MSLLELLAAVTITGVLAVVIVPRLGTGASVAKTNSCHVNREVINVQCALWRRSNGNYPASNLSDVGSDANFFPEGLPTCPVDGSGYQIDSSTGLVIGHSH